MHDQFTITIHDENGVKQFNIHQVVKRFGIYLLGFLLLIFGLSAFTITYLNVSVNKIEDKTSVDAQKLAATLKHLGGLLGILQDNPADYLQSGVGEAGLSNEDIDSLIEQRKEARKNKDFAESDRIRDLLAENGIALEDGAQGTTWRRA